MIVPAYTVVNYVALREPWYYSLPWTKLEKLVHFQVWAQSWAMHSKLGTNLLKRLQILWNNLESVSLIGCCRTESRQSMSSTSQICQSISSTSQACLLYFVTHVIYTALQEAAFLQCDDMPASDNSRIVLHKWSRSSSKIIERWPHLQGIRLQTSASLLRVWCPLCVEKCSVRFSDGTALLETHTVFIPVETLIFVVLVVYLDSLVSQIGD